MSYDVHNICMTIKNYWKQTQEHVNLLPESIRRPQEDIFCRSLLHAKSTKLYQTQDCAYHSLMDISLNQAVCRFGTWAPHVPNGGPIPIYCIALPGGTFLKLGSCISKEGEEVGKRFYLDLFDKTRNCWAWGMGESNVQLPSGIVD